MGEWIRARRYVDGQDAGLEMLKAGLAWVYEHYVGQAPSGIQERYRQAAESAREEHLGLWSDPEPVPPWEFRRMR